MLALKTEEKTWLNRYRDSIATRHPGKVVRMAVFGSKARGDANEHSDVDVLLIVNDDSVRLKLELERIGHKLATSLSTSSLVLPGIVIYTRENWDKLREFGSVFHAEVEREAVSVL